MRTKWYDRVLGFIAAVVFLGITVFLMLMLTPDFRADALRRITNLPGDALGTTLIIAGSAVGALLAIAFFAKSFGGRRPAMPRHVMVRAGEIGEVNITLDALDALVQKRVRIYPAVKDCGSHVIVTPQGDVAMRLGVTFMPDTVIPDICAQMQDEIREYIQLHTGVAVREIRILVESTGVNPSSRVV